MTIHSFTIFDRKGKTLFTKRYSAVTSQQKQGQSSAEEAEQLAEQRKLIFGMLFSLREIVGSLVPEEEPGGLFSVRTGASTIHNYETLSGLRFAMYTNNELSKKYPGAPSVRDALRHIYTEIWMDTVVRSPLYRPGELQAAGEGGGEVAGESMMGRFEVGSTNFEGRLDVYLRAMPWFR
mmetsp:Transcript_18904/g.26011  ORF Transcript_18904/g.26011 Transcript_18904/m.26011 type:complete len:179 (-) Transcript_18904:174-710(-)